jgi:hypothetical protein
LFIRVQNRHQRNFRKVEPFTKQIDSHQNIKDPKCRKSRNVQYAQGVDIAVQITHFTPLPLNIRLIPRRCVWSKWSPAHDHPSRFVSHLAIKSSI